MDAAIGTEWNTRVGFQRSTLPKIVTKVCLPYVLPKHSANRTYRSPEPLSIRWKNCSKICILAIIITTRSCSRFPCICCTVNEVFSIREHNTNTFRMSVDILQLQVNYTSGLAAFAHRQRDNSINICSDNDNENGRAQDNSELAVGKRDRLTVGFKVLDP